MPKIFGGKSKASGSENVSSGSTSVDETTRQQHGGSLPEDPAFAEKGEVDNSPPRLFTPRVFAMAMIVSIGGMIFGYGRFIMTHLINWQMY